MEDQRLNEIFEDVPSILGVYSTPFMVKLLAGQTAVIALSKFTSTIVFANFPHGHLIVVFGSTNCGNSPNETSIVCGAEMFVKV